MYKFCYSLLAFLLVEGLFGQMDMIKDPDGCCSVRQHAGGKATIIDTLYIDELVYILCDQEDSDWIQVDYIKKMKR